MDLGAPRTDAGKRVSPGNSEKKLSLTKLYSSPKYSFFTSPQTLRPAARFQNMKDTKQNSKIDALSDESRVWIYQAKDEISPDVAEKLQYDVDIFSQKWVSHNIDLHAAGEVRDNRFIILAVDETQTQTSGCSIDSSVRFIKEIEQKYKLDFFDRMTFAFEKDGKIQAVASDKFAEMYAAGEIDDNTVVFDNLVKTKAELDKAHRKKLGKSMYKRFV